MKKEIQKGYLALGIVSLFWGASYTASKIGNSYMPAIFLAGIRQFLAGLILVLFFVSKKYHLPAPENLKKIFLQAVLLMFLGNGLITWSLEYISSGFVAIIAALVPLFIAFLSIAINKYAMVSRWMFLGLFISLAGVCIIFYDYLGQIETRPFIIGISMTLLSILAWSFGSIYSSNQKIPGNLLFNVGLQMLISGSMLLVICFISGKYVSLGHLPARGIYALLFLIVMGSWLSYSAYIFALSKLPPTLVSVYAYINPVVAILLGWVLLKEKMNMLMIPGTLIVLFGVFVVNREFNKKTI